MYKIKHTGLLFILFVMILSGCKPEKELTGVLKPADQIEPPEEINTTDPFAEEDNPIQQEEQTDDDKPKVISENRVTITLDNEIQSTTHPEGSDLSKPGSTSILLSSKQEHHFFIHFLQEMNQSQVETILQKQFKTQLQFKWDGTDLHLTIPPLSEDEQYLLQPLSLEGTQTAAGEILQNQSRFGLAIQPPHQIWRVAADGSGTIEAVTNFTSQYPMSIRLTNKRFWLLKNWTGYCECDAPYPMLNYLYDEKLKTIQFLGISKFFKPLTTYQGHGPFWIDNRGFFLEKSAIDEADSNFQKLYQPNGYVQGATFSQDGTNVVFAVGEDAEDVNQDLVILNLETMEEEVYADVIPGFFYEDLNGYQVPLPLYDDDRYVYFHVTYKEDQPDGGYYLFEKETGEIKKFESNSGFHPPKYSYDNQYKAIPGDGIYQDNKEFYDLRVWYFNWSPTDNRVLVTGYDHNEIITMETLEKKLLDVPEQLQFRGWSEDGKWLYYFGP